MRERGRASPASTGPWLRDLGDLGERQVRGGAGCAHEPGRAGLHIRQAMGGVVGTGSTRHQAASGSSAHSGRGAHTCAPCCSSLPNCASTQAMSSSRVRVGVTSSVMLVPSVSDAVRALTDLSRTALDFSPGQPPAAPVHSRNRNPETAFSTMTEREVIGVSPPFESTAVWVHRSGRARRGTPGIDRYRLPASRAMRR